MREHPGGVETKRGGNDPLLVDVQLIQDRVPVRLVQIAARAQQSGGLARTRRCSGHGGRQNVGTAP